LATIVSTTFYGNTVRGGNGGWGGDAQFFGGPGGYGADGQGGGAFVTAVSVSFIQTTLAGNVAQGGQGGPGGVGDTRVGSAHGGGAGLGGNLLNYLGSATLNNTLFTGADVLHGDGGDDILIGGTTDYDSNLTALNAVMAEWGRTDADYATRVKHLSGALSGGLNGSTVLKAGTGGTVHDDAAIDTLFGEGGNDWFFALLSGTNKDVIKDQAKGEVVTGL
jgi:hypothetical protein